MKQIIFILSLLIAAVTSHAQSSAALVPYYDSRLWGYSDTLGNIIITPEYDAADVFTEASATKNNQVAIVQKGKWKYVITPAGKRISPEGITDIDINPGINRSEVSFILVRNAAGAYGVYRNGKFILSLAYDRIDLRPEQVFVVEKKGRRGLADSNGKLLTPIAYTEVRREYVHEKPGTYIWELVKQEKGKERITYIKSKAPDDLAEDLAEGPVIAPPHNVVEEQIKLKYAKLLSAHTHNFDTISFTNDAQVLYFRNENSQGIITTWDSGVHVISSRYNIKSCYGISPASTEAAKTGSNAYLVVKQGSLFGIINEQGKVILPPEYDEIEFHRGFYELIKGGKHGMYVLQTIYPIIPPKYDEIISSGALRVSKRWQFRLFLVRYRGKEVYIGESGKEYFRNL